MDKPAGMTSHDVVNRVRRVLHTKRVGHTGTLDPLATGVLVLCIGHATRLVEYFTSDTKGYETTVRLGVTSDTEDVSGVIIEGPSTVHLTESVVHNTVHGMVGHQLQTPPMVSALHHEGKRLYELARVGIVVDREARSITVQAAECLAFRPGERAEVDIRFIVSQGTYIRTLAADLGAKLGVGGIMTALRRTHCGKFSIQSAVSMGELLQDADPMRFLLPIESGWGDRPILEVSNDQAAALGQGKQVELPDCADSKAALVLLNSLPVGIVRIVDGTASPAKIFADRQ